MPKNFGTVQKLDEQKIKLELEKAKNFNKLIDVGASLIDKYLTAKIDKVDAPRFKWTLIALVGLLVLAVGITGFLVYVGKVSSENFTFLLGILIGSIITLVGDIIIGIDE